MGATILKILSSRNTSTFSLWALVFLGATIAMHSQEIGEKSAAVEATANPLFPFLMRAPGSILVQGEKANC